MNWTQLRTFWEQRQPLQRVTKAIGGIRKKLPWFGLARESQNSKVLGQLISSAARLQELKRQPGWADVEAIRAFWKEKYLLQTTKVGRMVIRTASDGSRQTAEEEDTEKDDRRRLIAAAQLSAIEGVFSEIDLRINAGDIANRRIYGVKKEEDTTEVVPDIRTIS